MSYGIGLQLEKKMESAPFRYLFNLFLVVLIYYNAEIGRLLGIQGPALAVSVVWPATGFSLAALLLFGYRVWPGIFFGNFAYNFVHLFTGSTVFLAPFVAALFISSGSLLQALVSKYILDRFSSMSYFNSVKDIFIFLVPAGIVTCLIASTIGATTLALYGSLSKDIALQTWLTFWIGDSMGVYVFTPLIVVWALYQPHVYLKGYALETILMVMFFLIVTYLTVILELPIQVLYIPLSIWVAFRFRMHGATAAIFLITLAMVIPTSLGYGTFVTSFVANPLLVLVVFLEVTVAVSLIAGALINEREAALNFLKMQNVDLLQAIQMHQDEIKDAHTEIVVKEKFASSLGILTSGISRQMQIPLRRIKHFAKAGTATLGRFKETLEKQKTKLDPGLKASIHNTLKIIGNYLENIYQFEDQADKIAKVIQEQSSLIMPGRVKPKSINLNALLETCLDQATKDISKRHPEFTFTPIKELDKAAKLVLHFPEDLSYAFINLFYSNIYSMKAKKDIAKDYSPVLELRSVDHPDKIEIVIRDNGKGVSEERLKIFFHTVLEGEWEEPVGIGLSLAHDIITQVHEGEIKAESQENDFLKISIYLPKNTKKQ